MIWALFIVISLPRTPVQTVIVPQPSEAHCIDARDRLPAGGILAAVCGVLPIGKSGVAM